MNQPWLFWVGLAGLLLVLVALGPRLLTALVQRLSEAESRRLSHDLRQRLGALNVQRRERGLGPFPSLAQFERLALRYARELTPPGAGGRRTEPYYDGTLDITFEGVVVLGDVQPDPELPGVVHLGEFVQRVDPAAPFLGTVGSGYAWQVHCGIIIYYGSFMQRFAAAPRQVVLNELRETVAHELRHLMDEEEHVPLRNSLVWSDIKEHHRWQRWLEHHGE